MPSYIKGRPIQVPITPAVGEVAGRPITGVLPIDPAEHALFARTLAPLRGFRSVTISASEEAETERDAFFDDLVDEFGQEIDIETENTELALYTDLAIFGSTPGIRVNVCRFAASTFCDDHVPPVEPLTAINYPLYFATIAASYFVPTDETECTLYIDRIDVDPVLHPISPATRNAEEELVLSDFVNVAPTRPSEFGTVIRAGFPSMSTVRTLFDL